MTYKDKGSYESSPPCNEGSQDAMHSDTRQGTRNKEHTTWGKQLAIEGSQRAMHCNTPQHTATHCNTLQHTQQVTHNLLDPDQLSLCQLTHNSDTQIAWAKWLLKSDTQKRHINCIYTYIYIYIYVYMYICIYYIQIHSINKYTHILT